LEKKRLKVQAFAKFYNYKPNNIALSLKTENKNHWNYHPEIVHHFQPLLMVIEQVANENGYSVIICLSDDSFDKEVLNLEMLANGSIDGFIMSLSKETQLKVIFTINTERSQSRNAAAMAKICARTTVDYVSGENDGYT
jgi:LacI family transcriptional regulator